MGDFLNWELTNRMHNLGYDGKTLMYIDEDGDIINDDSAELIGAKPAILTSAAFRWFREKYNLRQNIMDFIDDKVGIEWDYEIATIGTDLDENGNYKPLIEYSMDDENRKFKTYEKAELACLEKLIEIVESNQKEDGK